MATYLNVSSDSEQSLTWAEHPGPESRPHHNLYKRIIVRAAQHNGNKNGPLKASTSGRAHPSADPDVVAMEVGQGGTVRWMVLG